MKRLLVFTLTTLALLAAAPTLAAVTSIPLSANGIAPAEMVRLMSQHGWPAQLVKGNDGAPIVKSRVAGVRFDVNFNECGGDGCRDIQFAVGWSNAGPSATMLAKIDAWNSANRFLRAYLRPDHSLWAVMDARIARGTTANVEEYIVLWPVLLRQFKPYFNLQ